MPQICKGAVVLTVRKKGTMGIKRSPGGSAEIAERRMQRAEGGQSQCLILFQHEDQFTTFPHFDLFWGKLTSNLIRISLNISRMKSCPVCTFLQVVPLNATHIPLTRAFHVLSLVAHAFLCICFVGEDWRTASQKWHERA